MAQRNRFHYTGPQKKRPKLSFIFKRSCQRSIFFQPIDPKLCHAQPFDSLSWGSALMQAVDDQQVILTGRQGIPAVQAELYLILRALFRNQPVSIVPETRDVCVVPFG